MRVSPFIFGVEVEQAATVSAIWDRVYAEQKSTAPANKAVIDQYGLPGLQLADEYENEPNIADDGVTPLFVLLH